MTAYWPLIRRAIVITTANRGIRFREGASTQTANVAPGTYFGLDDGSASCIFEAVRVALEAAPTGSANTYAIPLIANPRTTPIAATDANAIGGVVLETGTDAFQILGADPLTTFPLSILGLPQANTALDVDNKVSTLSSSAWWVGNDFLSFDEPVEDGDIFGEDPTRGGVLLPGAHSTQWVRHRWSVQFQRRDRTLIEGIPSDPDRAWQTFWRRLRTGVVCRLARISADNSSITALSGEWIADAPTRRAMGVTRRSAATPLYSWDMGWHQWVTP
jgi:hypothetical protein